MEPDDDKLDRGPTASAQSDRAAEAERARLQRQRKRSIVIAVSLGLMALLFYLATLVKMGGS